MSISAATTRRRLLAALAAMTCMLPPAPARAQAERNVTAAWGGAAFGALGGATLGLLGGAAPCSLTLRGTTCARVVAGLGAAVGSTSGAVLGYHDPESLEDRLVGAGIGAAIGTALGLGARAAIRQIEARDIATVALAGGALGAAPRGSALGLGTGLVVGSVLWLALPDGEPADALALGLVGMALGGLGEWAWRAIEARDDARALRAQVTLRF